jgi:hypothetical protein
MEYKGYEIVFKEGLEFDNGDIKVSNKGGFVYSAEVKGLGRVFARTPSEAIELIKRLIDKS